jgi:arylsulfatase A-like enzyme
MYGVTIAAIDFALFEVGPGWTGIREQVLSKHGFLRLGLFVEQLAVLGAIAVAACLAVHLVCVLAGRRTTKPLPLVPVTVSVAGLSVLIISLGVMKNRWEHGALALLTGACAFLIVASLVTERTRRRRIAGPETSGSVSRRLRILTAFFAAILVLCWLLPDVYGLWNRATAGSAAASERRNVLIIVLDTVRPDRLACYAPASAATPNISRLADEGMLFENAFTTAPWTLPSHASMWTGLVPTQHGAGWEHLGLDAQFTTIAEELARDGYRTVGFTENPFTGRAFGLDQGFEEYHEVWQRPLVIKAMRRFGERTLDLRPPLEYAPRTVGLVTRWLRSNRHASAPFFAYINLMAAHLPNRPRPGPNVDRWGREDLEAIEPINVVPERFYLPRYRLSDRQLGVMRELYDAELEYLDRYVGEIRRVLESGGFLDNTTVVLTSDHGENFGEHGLIEHQLCLYDSLLRVPLIVWSPGTIEPQRVERRVSTVDLARLIRSLASPEADQAPDGTANRDLVALMQRDTVYAEYDNPIEMLNDVLGTDVDQIRPGRFDRRLKSLARGRYKLIWSSDGTLELFDIEADPGETRNLVNDRAELVGEMSIALADWLESLEVVADRDDAPMLDQDTLDALKALGYVQ